MQGGVIELYVGFVYYKTLYLKTTTSMNKFMFACYKEDSYLSEYFSYLFTYINFSTDLPFLKNYFGLKKSTIYKNLVFDIIKKIILGMSCVNLKFKHH